MPKVEAYVCQECGGQLSYSIKLGRLACRRCGHIYDADEMQQAIPVAGDVEPVGREHAEDADDFFERAPWEPLKEDEDGVAAYSCPICASQFLVDQATVIASCPYCGNTMLLSGIAQKETIPQLILPFRITQKRAIESVRLHFQGKWYLPGSFKPELAHIRGMYVPYYQYDIRSKGAAGFVGKSKSKYGYEYYPSFVTGCGLVRGILVDSSSRMPDAYMDSVLPFSPDRFVHFSPQYVAGYLMEVPDEDWATSEKGAKDLAYASFVKELSRHCSGKQSVIRESSYNAVTVRRTLCALPVWLFHYIWKERDYLFAVNGETGECVGDLPVSNARRSVVFLLIMPLLYILAFIIFVEMLTRFSTRVDGSENIVKSMLGFVIVGFLFVMSVPMMICEVLDMLLMDQMKPVAKATDASEAYGCPDIDASEIAGKGESCSDLEKACAKAKAYYETWVNDGCMIESSRHFEL